MCVQVLGASLAPILRLGVGALASGYKAEVCLVKATGCSLFQALHLHHMLAKPQAIVSSKPLSYSTHILCLQFVPDDASASSSYTLATVGGRRIKETSKVRAGCVCGGGGEAWVGGGRL